MKIIPVIAKKNIKALAGKLKINISANKAKARIKETEGESDIEPSVADISFQTSKATAEGKLTPSPSVIARKDFVNQSDFVTIRVNKNPGDSILLGEDINLLVDWHRAFSEEINLSNSISFAFDKPIIENVSQTEFISITINKANSDTVTGSENFHSAWTAVREFTENPSVNETISLSVRLSKTDSVTLSEGLILFSIQPGINEVVPITEVIAKAMTKDFYDFVTTSEEFQGLVADQYFPEDSSILSETLAFAFGKDINESIVISDICAITVYKLLTDIVTNTEDFGSAEGAVDPDLITGEEEFIIAFYKNVNETVSTSETILFGTGRSFYDVVSMNDDVLALNGIPIGLGFNTIGLNSRDNLAFSMSIQLADTVTISEAIDFPDGASITPSDNLSASEVFEIIIGKPFEDSLNTTEVFTKLIQPGPSEVIRLNLLEQLSYLGDGLVFQGDEIAFGPILADNIAIVFSKFFSETITISEDVNPLIAQTFTPSDGASVADAITITTDKSLTDTLSNNETKTAVLTVDAYVATDYVATDYFTDSTTYNI
jgi:pSer/pThr/pTyr-binding forkhead associated (FHA) protein